MIHDDAVDPDMETALAILNWDTTDLAAFLGVSYEEAEIQRWRPSAELLDDLEVLIGE